jgi:hypothetical protein
MVLKASLLCIGLALLPTAACGQNNPATPATSSTSPVTRAEFEQLSQNVARLTESVTRLADSAAANPAANERASTGQEANNASTPAAGATDVASPAGAEPTAYMLAAKIRELETKLEILEEVQRNHETQLGQIVMQDQDGSYHLQFNTKNAAARNEIRRAIQGAAPEEGSLVVNNRMSTDQFLLVDGDGYRIPAGTTRRISVGRGTISTNLPGQERVLWTIAGPDFEQSIDIRPRQTHAMATSAPVVATAVFVDPVTGMQYVTGR